MSDTLEKEIQQLINDLKVDLEDYKLLHTRQKLYDFTTYKNYLSCCIHDKLIKLKGLLGEQILNKILKEVENGRH